MKNIIKAFFFILIFGLVAGTLSSCKSGSVPLTPTTDTAITKETVETVKDTAFYIPGDSSLWYGNLGVLDGKIFIGSVTESKAGKHLAEPKVQIVDNKLRVDCDAYAQTLLAQYKDKHTTEVTETIKKIPYPVEKPFSWWQMVQLWSGRIFLIGVGLLIGAQLLNIPLFTNKNRNEA